jgi:hypothetical protein
MVTVISPRLSSMLWTNNGGVQGYGGERKNGFPSFMPPPLFHLG